MHEMDEKCRKCKNNETAICNRCDMFYDEFEPIDEPKQTNADRIRAMSDEELAEWLTMVEVRIIERNPMLERPTLKADWLEWLKL